MKYQLTFKTPDALDRLPYEDTEGLDEEQVAEAEYRREQLKNKLSKWITYGEYITVEYDSEEDTMRVI